MKALNFASIIIILGTIISCSLPSNQDIDSTKILHDGVGQFKANDVEYGISDVYVHDWANPGGNMTITFYSGSISLRLADPQTEGYGVVPVPNQKTAFFSITVTFPSDGPDNIVIGTYDVVAGNFGLPTEGEDGSLNCHASFYIMPNELSELGGGAKSGELQIEKTGDDTYRFEFTTNHVTWYESDQLEGGEFTVTGVYEGKVNKIIRRNANLEWEFPTDMR